MVIMKRKIVPAAIAAAVAVAIGGAYAAQQGNSKENDAVAGTAAKIDLTQAIASAEQHVGGKAAKAEYERDKGQWVFDVEVVKGQVVMDVKVDPASGKVIAATEDKVDHDDDKDNDRKG
jgi:uncharacterized membrane protein YkoI